MPKEVRNVQGTEEFVRAIENFEKLSIRVFESQLYSVRCVFVSLEREPTVSAVDGFFMSNSNLGINFRVAQQIYVFKVFPKF